MELYGSGAASSRFYKMIPFCFRVEHQNGVCRWICGAADLRHLTCQLLLLRNVLEEIPRFCRVWWESSGYCSCGSFCFFFDVVRCRALRLLELLQSLFYGRGTVCGFLFSRKAMKDRSCCIRWFDVLFVCVCVSLVVCVFFVCASIVSCVFSLRVERGLQVDSHSFKVAFFGSGSSITGMVVASSQCLLDRRGSSCLRM